MTSDVENLVLEHLRAIRADISEIKLKVDELAGSYIGLLKIPSLKFAHGSIRGAPLSGLSHLPCGILHHLHETRALQPASGSLQKDEAEWQAKEVTLFQTHLSRLVQQ
jgi:hypothetical protein